MQLAHLLLAHIDIPAQLVGALVVLIISILIALVGRGIRGAPKGLLVRPGAPPCVCGTVTKWKLPDNHWHCEKCNLPVSRPFACPTCKGPGRWLRESNAWGCDQCRALIPSATARVV